MQSNVTVNGTANPGTVGGAGTLSVTGNYTTSGTLKVDLLGASQFDVLAVSGALTLNGGSTLTTGLVGYTPTAGDSLAVLTFGSRSGDFLTKNLSSVSGLYWNPVYSGAALTLTSTATTVATWSGAGDGVTWNSAANWVGGTIPNGPQYDVSIPDSPPGTVLSVTLTTTVINSISSIEEDLDLIRHFHDQQRSVQSTFNGGLAVSSGTITLMSDALTNMTMSGGERERPRRGSVFSWTGSGSTWTSGTLNGTGSVRNTGSAITCAHIWHGRGRKFQERRNDFSVWHESTGRLGRDYNEAAWNLDPDGQRHGD